jgi:hypothetical protein
MNTLDNVLDSLSRAELSPAEVLDSQRKLDAVIGKAPRRPAKRRAAGWLAATASAVATVAAFVWLPLTSTQALAFADVQKNFREFDTLRFEFEQRVEGNVLTKGRVSLLANGSVRTEVGDDVVVIVNSVEKRVMTLIKSGRIAMVTPLDEAPKSDDSMKWLQEIRDFQGAAVAISESRWIRGQRAQGWKLATADRSGREDRYGLQIRNECGDAGRALQHGGPGGIHPSVTGPGLTPAPRCRTAHRS